MIVVHVLVVHVIVAWFVGVRGALVSCGSFNVEFIRALCWPYFLVKFLCRRKTWQNLTANVKEAFDENG